MTGAPSCVAVGAGRMGRGIALAYALRGQPIVLLDIKRRSSADAGAKRSEIEAGLRDDLLRLVDLDVFPAQEVDRRLATISLAGAADAAEVLSGAGLVYEAVPETVEAKREVLDRIGGHVPVDALIASTTSTMLAAELASMVPGPERLLNVHWLNPAFVVPLVEVSSHEGTRPETLSRVVSHLESLGKVPVVCGAHPGYIVPRLQALIMNEAARMVEEGVASAEDIDRATRFGLGFRYASMGVLEFVDYGGIDTLHHANEYLSRTVDPHRYETPQIVTRLLGSGKGGLGDGQGFHEYRTDVEAYRRDALARSLAMLRHVGLSAVDSPENHRQHQGTRNVS